MSNITVTWKWSRWRLKSPALPLFTQPFIQDKIKENMKAPRHWLCPGTSPVTGEFPAQMASNWENVSILWRNHVYVTNDARTFHITENGFLRDDLDYIG